MQGGNNNDEAQRTKDDFPVDGSWHAAHDFYTIQNRGAFDRACHSADLFLFAA